MSQNWTVEIRNEEGKGASRRLRHAGKVPAIIYGNKKDAVSVSLADNFVKKAFENSDNFNKVITLDVNGGDNEQCVIKDVQRHPSTNAVSHIDFQRAAEDSLLIKRIPFKFTGSAKSPGVKMGGLITYLQSTVEVSCLAKDLPTRIDVDVSAMEAGSSMRLSELTMPEGVVITALTHGNTDYDQAIVRIAKVKKKA